MKQEDLEVIYKKIEDNYEEIRKSCGILYTHFENETKPFIESGEFEKCFTILDSWNEKGSAVHKFQMFNLIAKKEAEVTGEKPRSFHERYKNIKSTRNKK